MIDFSITLDGKEYKVQSTSFNGKGVTDFNVSVNHGKVETRIHIPQDEKVTRAKVILFIEAFHVAMNAAFEAQKIDQNYT